MSHTTLGTQETDEDRSGELGIEAWKHFAQMGATDKNTMITTVSWLLALAATAIGYIVTEMSGPAFPWVQHPGKLTALSLLGIVVSVIASYLVILYAGYSNRNWAKADELAQERRWLHLLPKRPSRTGNESEGNSNRLAGFAWQRARPCNPRNELAPVFKFFLFLAVVALLVHGGLFVLSLRHIVCRESAHNDPPKLLLANGNTVSLCFAQ